MSYNSYTNGKSEQKGSQKILLEFRSENEFQHKLAEMELLVKAQVTKEEEAEDGGNDKGKSLGKNGGEDNTGKKGDSKGKITFTTWIKSGIGWVGSATTTGYAHQLKDCWRGNMDKGQPCCRLNTIDGKMSQSSSGRDQGAEATTCNCPQKRRMEQISNLSGRRTVE